SKLGAGVGLAEAPVGRRDVRRRNAAAVAGGDLEREGLAVEAAVALPVLSPVAAHRLPPGPRPLDGHRHHVPSTTNVGDQDQVEVGVAIDREPDASLLHARNSVLKPFDLLQNSEPFRNNACFVLRDALENRLREIEVLPGRVAPSAIVAGESVVGRAEVGRSDYDRPLETPSVITDALDLKTSSTALAIVEQSSAQCSSVGTITLAVEVPIPTGSSCLTLGQMEERLAQGYGLRVKLSGRVSEPWDILSHSDAPFTWLWPHHFDFSDFFFYTATAP
ncbi:hypothetical protein BHE74_00043166, partial [Ensete ventricosum]